MTVTLGKITSEKNIYPFISEYFCIPEFSDATY